MAIELREYHADRATLAMDDRDAESRMLAVAAASSAVEPDRQAETADETRTSGYWCCGIECC